MNEPRRNKHLLQVPLYVAGKSAEQVCQELGQGIIVRYMAGFGLPNAFRVTVGLREQNQQFLVAMQLVLARTPRIPA